MRHSQIQQVIDTPETREFLKSLFQKNLEEGTDKTSVLRFGEALVDILKSEVGSYRGKRASSGGDTTWRSELKSMFSGRGRQWIKVTHEFIQPYLDKFDEDGIDTKDYRSWIESKGHAWVRFNGPRIHNGVNSGGFEIRTSGSKIDHPKQLCYIPSDELIEDKIDRLPGTPFSMGLEIISKSDPEPEIQEKSEDNTSPEETIEDTPNEEIIEEIEEIEEKSEDILGEV